MVRLPPSFILTIAHKLYQPDNLSQKRLDQIPGELSLPETKTCKVNLLGFIFYLCPDHLYVFIFDWLVDKPPDQTIIFGPDGVK